MDETARVDRIVLARRGGDVEVREPGGTRHLPVADLPAYVADRATAPVRWLWDDTTRWYPALLEQGVRVARCTDLRLCHAVLRRSPLVDQALLTADETPGCDALQPVTGGDAALFPLDDPADLLDPVAEHARQRAALEGRRAVRGWACCSRQSPRAPWWRRR